YYQSLLGFKKEISYLEVKNFEKYFNLKELIDIKIEYLTTEEAALIKILSFLIIKPSVLGLDNILSYLSIENKLKVLKYAKKNEVVILNVTSMSDELLLGTDIVVLDKYKVVKYSKTNEILNDDKLLLEIGFEPPFATSLSQGLNYYDLLDKKYHNNKSLVEAIWK
ncbi:MAG: hypothetical protein PHF21_00210, partial [Bacilli bacterium]|nr:hypothetical protein [Bacilli bacterium]